MTRALLFCLLVACGGAERELGRAGLVCIAPAVAGCSASRTFNICDPTTCTNACSSVEFALTCRSLPTDTAIPQPPASMDCKVLPLPTPSNTTVYCCPCT